jgi:hypothetical protein
MLTTEQTLERVLRIARSLPETERQYFDFAQKHPVDCGKNHSAIGVQLSALVIDLRETIATEEECKRGRAAPYAAAKRICKRTVDRNSHRPSTQGAWIDSEGKQCLCDGMTGVRLNSPFKLAVAPEPECGERFDLDAVIRPIRLNSIALKSLPAEVRAKIKSDRAEYKASGRSKYESFVSTYDFGVGLPLVNAEYLLDLLELFPDCEIYAHDNPLYPIYFKSVSSEAVLCPIRKSEKG